MPQPTSRSSNRTGRFRRKRRFGRGALAFFGLVLLFAWRYWAEPLARVPLNSGAMVVVERVVDGDTLLLANGERVRLLGVNTPETKHPSKPVEPFGEEASAFTRAMVEGRTVRLELDRERRDAYGRILAYVYIDQRFLNEELIRAGLSFAQTRFPYSEQMKRRFKLAEAEARTHRRGLWSLRRDQVPVGIVP